MQVMELLKNHVYEILYHPVKANKVGDALSWKEQLICVVSARIGIAICLQYLIQEMQVEAEKPNILKVKEWWDTSNN